MDSRFNEGDSRWRLWPAKLALALVAGGSLLLGACGGGGDNSSSAKPTAAPAATASSAGSGLTPVDAKTVNGHAVCPPSGAASELTGAGATSVFPLVSKWVDDYQKQCSTKVNYQSVGSGAGINQLTQKTVDFGASDAIMT